MPQLAELKPAIASAPPMKGKVGNEPKVVKFLVMRPLEPVEHSTVSRDFGDDGKYDGAYWLFLASYLVKVVVDGVVCDLVSNDGCQSYSYDRRKECELHD